MISEELKENIKRHYGDSDADLADLATVMDALTDVDQVDVLKRKIETMTLDHEREKKELDESWRKRYRERFFDGDVSIPDLADLDASTDEEKVEDISIEEYIAEMTEKK